MRNFLGPLLVFSGVTRHPALRTEAAPRFPSRQHIQSHLWLLAAAVLALAFLLPPAFAQSFPHVNSVDPTEGKVDENVTLAGEHLGKNSVVAVFLSDDKTDHKAGIVQQTDEKIVMKVPKVKAGDYNVSVQSGNNILILPVRFKVDQ